MISLIFSSLYIYIDKKENNLSLNDHNKIIQLMNFFNPSDYVGSIQFSNIYKIKWFLKQHKKFSKMLEEPKKGFEELNILLLFQFLKEILTIDIFYSKDFIIKHYLYFPINTHLITIFQQFIENHLSLTLLSNQSYNQSSNDLLNNNYRMIWLQTEQLWPILQLKHTIYFYYYIYSIIKTLFNDLYSHYQRLNIWTFLNIDDLITSHPKINIQLKIDLDESKFQCETRLPIYPSHICPFNDIIKYDDNQWDDKLFILSHLYEYIKIHKYIYIFPLLYKMANYKTIHYLYHQNKTFNNKKK